MAQNRCPLCGGKVVNGECIGCGYSLPDEEKLSAPYNLDPEDDRPEIFEPAPEKYEMPGVDMNSVGRYGAAPVKEKTAQNIPNIKVAPTINNNPAPQNTPQGWQNPYGNSPAQRNTPQRNSPQQNTPQNTPKQGWQNPYNYNPAQRPARNPVNGTSSPLSQKAMIATLIVLLVLTLFTPMFGVIGLVLNGSFGTNLGAGTKKLFTILFIVALWASFLIKI
ncbi:MAG: hypothetical protein ACI4I1_04895 [Oscillospiraceae bacterium]